MIGVDDLPSYHRPGGDGYEYARRLALYDYRRHGGSGIGLYQFKLFRNQSSLVALGIEPNRYRPEFLFEFTIQVGTQTP